MEKGKISASQLGMMLYMSIIPTALLTSPAISFKHAKQDLWISPLWAISGLVAIFIVLQFRKRYPEDDVINIFEKVIGKTPSKLITFVYFLFFLILNGIIIKEYSEFVVGTFLRQTPEVVIIACMVTACAYAVQGGVEILGRFAQLLLPTFITLFVLTIMPIIPDLDWHLMFPILENGVTPSIKGSYVLQTWYSEMMISTFLLPYVTDQHMVKKNIFFSLLAIIITLIFSNLTTLLLLGNLTGSYTYPFLILARYINIADFITHLESLYMAIWVVGAFVKISVFYYIAVLISAKLFNLMEYKHNVLPIGLFLVLFSIWVAPNVQELTFFIASSQPLMMMTMLVVVPGVLLIFVWVKSMFKYGK